MDDVKKPETVPTIALELFAVSTAETAHRMLSEPLYARRLISLLKTGHYFDTEILEDD